MILTLKFPHDQINKSFYLPKAQFHRFHDKMSLDSNTNKVIQFTESKSDESTYESDEKISHSISPHQKLSKDAWIDYKTRFDNVARLYDGAISLERLFNSHVCVSNNNLYVDLYS